MPGFRSLHSEEYSSPSNYKQQLSIVEIRKQLTKVLENEEKLKPSDHLSQIISSSSVSIHNKAE